jgi:hypothetical protein
MYIESDFVLYYVILPSVSEIVIIIMYHLDPNKPKYYIEFLLIKCLVLRKVTLWTSFSFILFEYILFCYLIF